MSKIPLYVSSEKAYVWTVQDASDLRAKHRICGTLSGTLPHLTQQNFFLGLPLLLMPEEVVLLVENGIAVLVDDNTAREPYPDELVTWDEERKKDIEEQIGLWKVREEARQNLDTGKGKGKGAMSEAAIQKRKEREERRQRELQALTEGEGKNDRPNVHGPAREITSNQPQPHYTIRIPATSLSYPWYQPRRYEDLKLAKKAGIWNYPRTREELASCRVFRDLWEKGHFLGSGLKFGGEYLVYPDDPLRYHSHFTASVIPSLTTPIRPMEIVAHGRLGTATKKAHLLSAYDEDTQKIEYLSIEWASFG